MPDVPEPPALLIETVIECGRRIGCFLTWQEAREIAFEILGNTANDNRP